jgi:hypothetical protein
MKFGNCEIITITEDNKTIYKPFINGQKLGHTFDNEEHAIIFTIAYNRLQEPNEARYAAKSIMKMLSK